LYIIYAILNMQNKTDEGISVMNKEGG